MNTEKIREALESGIIEPGLRKAALAELDKAQQPSCGWDKCPHGSECVHAMPPQVQQPGKVLTDQELISAYNRAWQPAFEANDHTCVVKGYRAIERLVIERNGYLAPAAGLTVDEVMDVMDEWTGDKPDSFRSRLTAALEAKTRTA